ncbi:hypothetical protein BB561_003199 [Smittium simulii]|uniref:General transcription and DNA repair factor IIH subunit TFB2 n=1 Tax=Smittium simulii TaxID=133385 RepID=A0A2T9YML2_9FUNG|nr:hypothetical protein BB561_003199 [Smittium simulii]
MALRKGITADQIVSYLNTYAHPQVKNRIPPVPITVSDQIKLWEQEKERIKSKQAYLYHEFNRQNDFDAVYKYAEQLGVVLWGDEKKRIMAVSFEGHESVKNYVKRRLSANKPTNSVLR